MNATPDELRERKATLRRQVRAVLDQIPSENRAALSAQACAKLRAQIIWQQAQNILYFAPLADEVDVWPLLAESLAAGKIVALPRFFPAAGFYVACRVRDLRNDVWTGKFDIREPVESCAEIPASQLDLVLAPGVAFAARGGRLGRGKGFYDRLLSDVCGTKCGVAFEGQIVREVPAGPQDARVNCIVTPARWIEV